MKYGIFDSRPNHNLKPFMFQDEVSGEQEPAIFDDKEKAEQMAFMMNFVSDLTTYVVKPMGKEG